MTEAVYKILTAPQWAAVQEAGVFHGSEDDLRDGFIHLSTASQIAGTLARHFAGQTDLVIARVDTRGALAAHLRWEPSRAGALFPHLYAALPLDALAPTERPPA